MSSEELFRKHFEHPYPQIEIIKQEIVDLKEKISLTRAGLLNKLRKIKSKENNTRRNRKSWWSPSSDVNLRLQDEDYDLLGKISYYEKLLEDKYDELNRLALMKSREYNKILTNQKELRQKNGSIPEMFDRGCYTRCQKKSWCDLSGICDPNYYCIPSNNNATIPEPDPDAEYEVCIQPENKKKLGGRKMTNKKNKRLMRKRKTYRRKPNKKKTLKSRKRKQTRYRK